MKSMTGFGRGISENAYGSVTTEIKSVNSRYIEINIRGDHLSGAYEDMIRKLIRERITRGKLNVTLSFSSGKEDIKEKVSINQKLLDQYIEALENVQKEYLPKGKKRKIKIADLLAMPEPWITVKKSDIPEEVFLQLVHDSAASAIDRLLIMREKEGLHLREDLLHRLSFLQEKLAFIISRQDREAKEFENRLRSRIQKYLEDSGLEIDEGRIAEEVALFAEKADFTEETVRFASHLKQFGLILNEPGAIGRRLDFLLQEMNREINTTASKASDTEVIDCVIIIKTELEKIREQVQNIE